MKFNGKRVFKRKKMSDSRTAKKILYAVYINFTLMFIIDNYDILMFPTACFGKKRDKKEAALSSPIG